MLWVVLIGLFLLIVIYILFATLPVFIYSSTNSYYILLKRFFNISVENHKSELLKIHTRVFFLNFDFFRLLPIKKEKIRYEKQRHRIYYYKLFLTL